MKHNIDHVLDKYWDGQSSVEDEILLREYFCYGEVDVKHQPFKDLFIFYSEQSKITYKKDDIELDYSGLLDKYWEGETSETEERILRHYFSCKAVREEHKVFVELFQYFENQRKITYDGHNVAFNSAKPKIKILNLRRIIFSVAAASVLLFAAITVMKEINPNPVEHQISMVNEIDDPEEALRVTKEALAMVSKTFRASQQTVRENMGSLEKAAIFK